MIRSTPGKKNHRVTTCAKGVHEVDGVFSGGISCVFVQNKGRNPPERLRGCDNMNQPISTLITGYS